MVANVFNLTVFLFVSIFSSSFLPFTSKIWSRTENLISYKLFVFHQFFVIHFFCILSSYYFFPILISTLLYMYLRVCLSVCHLSVSMFVFLSLFGYFRRCFMDSYIERYMKLVKLYFLNLFLFYQCSSI